MIGTRLAHYEITSHLGTGGMGEVYQATDSKLGRSVAIKLLPEEFTHDTGRVARFEREARVLASLNHPNIAAIHGIEESDGRKFLVMELAPGETLAEKINRGAIPLEESLGIAVQITDALEAAHEKGVVHRDLKPANIKVTADGKVKVLDFGLAKAFGGETPNPSHSNSPTLSLMATQQGVILGTAAYMSPEQAKGREVDRRTDIFAFGAVLYEMLTGQQAFAGEDAADILSHVLRSEPDWTLLPANVPPRIRELLKLCLQKDAKKRRSDANDVRLDMEQAQKNPESAATPGTTQTSRLPWAVALVLATALVVMGILYIRHPVSDARTAKLFLPPPEDASFGFHANSPDGSRVAFTTRGERSALWIRDMDALTPRRLAGTDGARGPFWSPDSRFVAFFADGKLKMINAAAGPAVTICDVANDRGGSWGTRRVIVFAPEFGSGGLFQVFAAAGSYPTPLTMVNADLGENSHRLPWFLPDGRHFLFTARSADPEKSRIYIGDLESKDKRVAIAANSNAMYVPPGYLLFMRARTLMAVPFNVDKGAPSGEEIPLAEQVNFDPLNVNGQFSVSENGLLTYVSGRADVSVQLTWLDRSGQITGMVGAPSGLSDPAIAPDEKTVSFLRSGNIWLHDLTTHTEQLFSEGRSHAWSHDSAQIAYAFVRPEIGNFFRKPVGGTGREEVIFKEGGAGPRVDDWSGDEQYLIVGQQGGKTREDLFALKAASKAAIPIRQTPASERNARLSPNGQWLAYVSDETSRDEVYVIPFTGSAADSLARNIPISTSGGHSPVWSRDGSELFFIAADEKMMAVRVKPGAKFEAGPPGELFPTRLNGPNAQFAVSKDGRFLLPMVVDRSGGLPMTVVLNWRGDLKLRVPR